MRSATLIHLLSQGYFSPAEVIDQAVIVALRGIVVPFLISLLLVLWSIKLSQRYNILARPSARGSHTLPTPRLGGLGMAAAFYITSLLLAMHMRVLPTAWYATLVIGGAWAVVGGALDDVYELPPRWKLLVQLAAVLAPVALGFWPTVFTVPMFGNLHLPAFVGIPMAVLFALLLINVVNFMDGMDGHAASFGMMGAFGLGVFLLNFGLRERVLEYASAFVLLGATAGLLVYNMPGRSVENKTFMGDSGSQFLGFILAILALRASEPGPGQFPLIASFILFSPFIYDVAYTMWLRFRRGEDLTQAHRSHLYQRLMVAGWSHGRTLLYNLVLWGATLLLALCYGVAHQAGRWEVQLFCLLLTGVALWLYTWSVVRLEKEVAAARVAETADEPKL